MKPSSSPIYKFIRNTFDKIGRVFISHSPLNHLGIVSAFDRTTKNQQMTMDQLPSSELISYFEKFLKGEKVYTKEFKNCIHHLKKEFEVINKIQRLPPEDRHKEKAVYLQTVIKDITNLKKGEYRLIEANHQIGNQVFYLFSRDDNGITFKVIGRGQAMIALSGVKEVSVKGKAKIPAAITYQGIPKELILNEAWLKLS